MPENRECYEVNFDGLVGPTHNYSGLAIGNLPSMQHKNLTSNPKAAALQGLHKMKNLADLGLIQGVLPPQERPFLPLLRTMGFTGKDSEIIREASKNHPELFVNLCSAACMWSANAATISPSVDTEDGLVHITPANLSTELHRSIETDTTAFILKKIFNDPHYFLHHDPLPKGPWFANEGAANHLHFFKKLGEAGVHLFVYGKHTFGKKAFEPVVFPARETYESSLAIARQHRLFPKKTLFVQQNPRCIDLGVFHNDVISTSNANFFLYHENAFVSTKTIVEELEKTFQSVTGTPLITYMVKDDELTISESVETYLFNSQIVSTKDNLMTLFAPAECQKNPRAKAVLNKLVQASENPIEEVQYIDVKESMQNGGGPACLRLRVPLLRNEIDSITSDVLLNEQLYLRLLRWIDKHYRDRLEPKDLQDPKLYEENKAALEDLTHILKIGSIYSFQK